MSKSIFAKVAAVACSVATLGMLGIAASAQTDTELADRDDIVAGKTNIVAGIVKAEAGETVKFPVYVANNTGYAATGIRLIYDQALSPVLKADGKLTTKKGDAGDDIMPTFSHNPDERIIGLGTMGTELEEDSGVMFTVEITVPADAKSGAKYPMNIEVDRWLDQDANAVEYTSLNGYIYVGEIADTTTTTETTTTAEVTTTTVSEATTTVSEETTTSVSDDTTTTTVTTATTKKQGAGVSTTSTTKKGGTSSNTTASKTGDAGVGVAVAGLLLAAGTAVVATKKKKD